MASKKHIYFCVNSISFVSAHRFYLCHSHFYILQTCNSHILYLPPFTSHRIQHLLLYDSEELSDGSTYSTWLVYYVFIGQTWTVRTFSNDIHIQLNTNASNSILKWHLYFSNQFIKTIRDTLIVGENIFGTSDLLMKM